MLYKKIIIDCIWTCFLLEHYNFCFKVWKKANFSFIYIHVKTAEIVQTKNKNSGNTWTEYESHVATMNAH